MDSYFSYASSEKRFNDMHIRRKLAKNIESWSSAGFFAATHTLTMNGKISEKFGLLCLL